MSNLLPMIELVSEPGQTGRVPRIEVNALHDDRLRDPAQPSSLPEIEDVGSSTGVHAAISALALGEGEDDAKDADDSATGSQYDTRPASAG